jgi:hypothetical protein
MRSLFKVVSLTVALAAPVGLALAKAPPKSAIIAKHPNLDAAQKLLAQAVEKIDIAQKANEYDMDGHAQKARELVQQANDEIKLAAEAARKNPPDRVGTK